MRVVTKSDLKGYLPLLEEIRQLQKELRELDADIAPHGSMGSLQRHASHQKSDLAAIVIKRHRLRDVSSQH